MMRKIEAPQTNPDSRPRSVPALELHSRAASSVGITSPFQQSQQRKQFRRKADNEKITKARIIIKIYRGWKKEEKNSIQARIPQLVAYRLGTAGEVPGSNPGKG